MMKSRVLACLGLGLSLACAQKNLDPRQISYDEGPTGSEADVSKLDITYEAADSNSAVVLQAYALNGMAQIERFFGRSFPEPVMLTILPDREAFDAYAAKKWGLTQTQCWMVGAAGTHDVVLLTTRLWEPACDHDASDERHVRDLLVHEFVHAFHMQINPSDEFERADEVGWFVEGLATYVSGQLEAGHLVRAHEAVEKGETPDHLVDAWSGPYRYGVAGSMAAFLDELLGRGQFGTLLAATTQAELLDPVGMTERDFLEAWKAWVLSAGTPD